MGSSDPMTASARKSSASEAVVTRHIRALRKAVGNPDVRVEILPDGTVRQLTPEPLAPEASNDHGGSWADLAGEAEISRA